MTGESKNTSWRHWSPAGDSVSLEWRPWDAVATACIVTGWGPIWGHLCPRMAVPLSVKTRAPRCISLVGMLWQSTTDRVAQAKEIYRLTALEARSPKSRHLRGWLLRTWEQAWGLSPWLVFPWGPSSSFLYACLCGQVPPFAEDTSHVGADPPWQLHSNRVTSVKTCVSKSDHILRYLGVRTPTWILRQGSLFNP